MNSVYSFKEDVIVSKDKAQIATLLTGNEHLKRYFCNVNLVVNQHQIDHPRKRKIRGHFL